MHKKIKTVIASVLKPVDDTRMFEKFGLSLQQSNKYEVNIIGFKTKNNNLISEIHFIPAFFFSRLSIKRFLAPLKFFWITLKLKPDLLIITTHELIIPAVLIKIMHRRCKLIYDVQENYFRNMMYHSGFSKCIRMSLAYWIRAKEIGSAIFFSLYTLAEVGYTKEISFSKFKQVVVLNKFKLIPCLKPNTETFYNTKEHELKIVFSGTIHKVYGIDLAIRLAKELSKYLALSFLVIGSTKDTKLLKKLTSLSADLPWLHLYTDTSPIPHPDIINAIQQADFGVVSHQPIPSIENCFPTRIYELMAYRKPILLQNHAPWVTFCQPWDSAIPLDFHNFDAKWIAEQMLYRKFYKFGTPNDIFWESEEEKLLLGIERLFNSPI